MHQKKCNQNRKKIIILNTTKGTQTRKNEQAKEKGKTELLQNEIMSRVLTSFLPNGQCCDIRNDIKQQICPLQYLLHRPWRWSILDFCTGEWRSGPIQSQCARTACCPPQQQSTRPNGGSATFYCQWIQQPIYIHLSRNMQVEANIVVMFICFWLQNVCKCICKLRASIRLMAKCQTIP